MGWRYECEICDPLDGKWITGYIGNSLLGALRCIFRWRRAWPGHAYRMVIR